MTDGLCVYRCPVVDGRPIPCSACPHWAGDADEEEARWYGGHLMRRGLL